MFCLLYFCQGFPWGFATIALLAALSEAGYDKADTATITAMAMLPWTFKFFWAPLIDSIRLPAFGIRRPWIVFAQLGMAATLFGAWSSGRLEGAETLIYLSWVLFFHNCFASLQDVATDAMAVDLLEDDERGPVVGYMWASKVVGISAGGAGLAIVMASMGLATAIVLQAAVILAVCALMVAFRERPGERLLPWSVGAAVEVPGAQRFGLSRTLNSLRQALSNRVAFVLLFVALGMILAEGLFMPLTTELFVQHFGWSAQSFSTMQGTWGVTGEMVGALGGGYLASRFGSRRVALYGIGFVIGVMLLYGATSGFWLDPAYPHTALLPAFRGGIAFMTVALFAVFMKSCWTVAAATQFTLYMALANIGYTVGSKLHSWLPALGVALDYHEYYLLGGVVPLFAFILLLGIDPDRENLAGREAAERAAAPAVDVA